MPKVVSLENRPGMIMRGKVYYATQQMLGSTPMWLIKDDAGDTRWYYKVRFKELSELEAVTFHMPEWF